MPRLKVIFRDRRIEVREAARVVETGGRVRLLDEGGDEVAAWDADEVSSVQEVEERGDRSQPQWSE